MCNFCSSKHSKLSEKRCNCCGYISRHHLGEFCCQCVNGVIIPKENLTWIGLVSLFKREIGSIYKDYWSAVGMCRPTSIRFKLLCRSLGFDVDIKEFRGDYHVVNIKGNIVIDWTYRQFDKTCRIPHIYRLEKEE